MKELSELNNDLTFEEAFDALKETVSAMEDPKTTLDESLALYDRTCILTRFCRRKLRDVRLQVTDIHSRMSELKNSDEEIFDSEELRVKDACVT